MNYLSIISIIYIWFIFNQTKIFRFNKKDKNIILKSLSISNYSNKNKKDIENYINKTFSSYLKENNYLKKAFISFVFSFDDDIFWIFKLKYNKKINIEKIKWYFKKKKKIENFFEYHIFNTEMFALMNSSGMYYREIGATDFSCMVYKSLHNKEQIFFGHSKDNLNKISSLYLKDYIALERWKNIYFK